MTWLKIWHQLVLVLLVAAGACLAQTIEVHSEFQRIGPDGNVIPIDRAGPSREILSPAVARNAFASYHLTATIPAGASYEIHVGLNPEKAVRVDLYREIHNDRGIPDALEPVKLPIVGQADQALAVTYWMDLWVDRDAPVRRIKVEPQLWINDRWIIYPMEVRVTKPVVPWHRPKFASLPPAGSRADSVVYGPMRECLCETPERTVSSNPPTIRAMIHRNVQQDMVLARSLGLDRISDQMLLPAGIANRNDWCSVTTVSTVGSLPAEWYLRVRDFLYRAVP